jgi:hypothetical protein
MEKSDAIFDNFLLKVQYLIETEQYDQLSESQLLLLARELGLSAKDWEFLLQKTNAYLIRARNHFKHKNYIEVLSELNDALLIFPSNKELLLLAAKANLLLWKTTLTPEAKDNARYFADKLIYYFPDDEQGYWVVNQTNTAATIKLNPIYYVVFILVLLATGVYWIWSNKETMKIVSNKTKSESAEIRQNQEVSYSLYQNENLSVDANKIDTSILSIKIEKANFVPYIKSFSIKFKADLRVKQFELKHLSLRVKSYAANERLLKNSVIDLISYQPASRPGDILPVSYLLYDSIMPQTPVRTEISVEEMDARPALSEYEPSKVVNIENAGKYKNFKLEIRERSKQTNVSDILKQTSQDIELEVQNKGINYIDKLCLKFHYKTLSGIDLGQTIYWANISDDPAIKPEQTRVISTIKIFKNLNPDETILYQVFIEQIE